MYTSESHMGNFPTLLIIFSAVLVQRFQTQSAIAVVRAEEFNARRQRHSKPAPSTQKGD
jgi:hypothetical protein